jgi:anaerobic selenocysteine-containing dehydrogenase
LRGAVRHESAGRGKHVVGFEPRYDFPVNEGRLCPKGVTAYLQTHHPDRLLHPLYQTKRQFRTRDWDEALDLIASKFQGNSGEIRQRRHRRLFGFLLRPRKLI